MNERIRIGSFQGSIVDNDFECNLNKVKEVLNQTRDKGLAFLCFPETYLSGYSEQANGRCPTSSPSRSSSAFPE